MISSAPKQKKVKFDSYTTNLVEPIYDTVNGESVYIPAGYTVKVTGKSATPGYHKVLALLPSGFIRLQASDAQLGLNLKVMTDESDIPTYESSTSDTDIDEIAEVLGPKIPRIYQEYGSTFLIYKQKAELSDAPGVGKTLQALVAADRVMEALRRRIDPLELCYVKNFENMHDEKNTHPITRPEWAAPNNAWESHTTNFHGTSITVHKKVGTNFHWPERFQPCTVIVAPNHLCSMWFKAIRLQFPDAHVALATGSGSTKKERMSVLGPGRQFYIVNYEMMRPAPEPKDSDWVEEEIITDFGVPIKNKRLRDDYVVPTTFVDLLNLLNPVCVIFDEAHNMKSVKSKQAQECAAFAHRIPFRFLLTATPIKREADDLYMQLHVMNEFEFDGHHQNDFMEDYCFFNQTEYGKSNVQLRDPAKRKFWFNRIATLEEAANSDVLSYDPMATKKSNKKYNTSFTNPNLAGYILGRSYADVGLYLPPVLPANIPVDMDGNIRKVYNDLKSSYKASFDEYGEIDVNSQIAMLHSLRILCACPAKYKAIQGLIEDNEGPFAIFCEYRPSGEFLAEMLGTTFISGEVPVEERETLVASLLREGKPIVGMGRVIGTGINAMADCNVIINFEADWTPGERTQRIGRVQRWSPNRKEGQPVLLFDVFCTDTIDQHVYEVQRNRGISIRDIIKVELGLK